jgi:superfamily II DNA or RNA helicase
MAPLPLQPGDIVVVRDECWTVARVEAFEHCSILTLEGRGPGNLGRGLQAITPFDHVGRSPADRPRRRRRRTVLRAALAAVARERPALGLWTAAEASLDLIAYQLEPALAVLGGATRVLLADAVGLGKTVQAALILAELRLRGLADHALILCPAGLREAWAGELRQRFGIESAVLDHLSIEGGHSTLPAGVNPWAVHPVVIASIDLVKRPEVLAAVEAAAFDVVIADEAHHLTPASDRGHAVSRLAARSPWLILLSATPHSGDQAAFDFLTSMGALGDPIVVFRRGRSDVGLPSDRRSHLLRVAPTRDEAHLLHATAGYARAIWHARGRADRAVQLVAIMLARRAASSAVAVARTLTRRRALLAGAAPAPIQGSLPWDDSDESDHEEPDERLARPGLPDEAAEFAQLDRLISLAQRAALRSSKLHRLQRLLARAGEPAVVFTEYRDTLQATIDALAPRFRLGAIHGGVPAPVRQEVLQRFARGDLDVLVATDAAGEGLNLHHRCRLVIDLELPWNPLRLEQRVGRVDRIGQRRRVHALHLLQRDTVEALVWTHLEDRRRRAERALEACTPPTDEDMARLLFDAVPLPVAGHAAFTSQRVVEAGAELARALDQRRWRRFAPAILDRPVFALPRRRWCRTLIAVHETTALSAAGGLLERRLVASVITLDPVPTAGAWREVVTALRPPAITTDAELALQPLRLAVAARIQAARKRLASPPRRHQASLFARRAARAPGARLAIIARIDAALAHRAASLVATPSSAPPRLVALWPITGPS